MYGMYVCMYFCMHANISRRPGWPMSMYVRMYVWMYVCIHMYVCMQIFCVDPVDQSQCMYVCMYVCMHGCMYVYVCMCVWVYVCMSVCMYVFGYGMDARIFTSAYIYTYHMYVCL